jgi:F-type H+-transporting ATPase subunit b
MLSRLSLRTGSLRPALQSISNRGVLVLAARSSSSGKEIDHVANWDKANATYYGPERDTKNFPHPVQAEGPPPTRMGFIPEAWFKAFYEKTGVTGPYVFGAGALTFMASSELLVIEHGFAEFITFWAMFAYLAKKTGPWIGNYFTKMDDEFVSKRWEQPIALNKQAAQESISELQRAIEEQGGQKLMYAAKRENVDLQLEAVYRQRLSDVYTQVKKRLDYQLSTDNAEKRFQQTHMANWIVSGVLKSITPQQEKDSIAKCIQDLKALSKKQAVTATA